MGHLNDLPLTLPFFSILVAELVVLVAVVEIGALRYAYLRLAVNSTCSQGIASGIAAFWPSPP